MRAFSYLAAAYRCARMIFLAMVDGLRPTSSAAFFRAP
nr:MAG TPA: hypothetical protein [Caudoviricetes sp.]